MKKILQGMSPASLVIWGVVLLLVLILVALGAVSRMPSSSGDDEVVADVKERVLDVSVRTVATRALSDVVNLPGVLEPWADVYAAAEKAGRIVEMAVDLGDRVKKGDLLWRVDAETWEAMARRAEVDARETAREYDRIVSLRETGAVSESSLDAARRARDVSAAVYDEARSHVSKCTALSPIDGRIEERLLDLGEHPGDAQVVLRIVDTRRLKLIVHVPEQDVLSVAVGDRVAFTLSAVPGRELTGTVRFVSNVGRPGSNAFRTEMEVDNAAGELKAGMIASVKLVRSAREGVVAVPLNAVVNDKGEHVVYVVEDGRAVRRRVRLHAIQDQLAVLEDGLREGETLVVAGQRRLQDGRPVRIVEPVNE